MYSQNKIKYIEAQIRRNRLTNGISYEERDMDGYENFKNNNFPIFDHDILKDIGIFIHLFIMRKLIRKNWSNLWNP